MRKVAILRFGLPLPHTLDMLTAQQFANGEAMSTSFGMMGVITIIETEHSANTIATWMAETHEKHKQHVEAEGKKAAKLPFIVFDLNSEDTGTNIDQSNETIKHLFEEMKVEPLTPFTDSVVKCTLTLDQLLEKVKVGGVSALTEDELTRLNELSGNV